MIRTLTLAQSGFNSALCCVSIACALRSKIRAEKKKFFVAIQSLAISIGTSGYRLEHLATPFKGKLFNSVFRTKPNQNSGLAGPTAQRAAPPKRRLPGYADDRLQKSLVRGHSEVRSLLSLLRGLFASLLIIRA